MCVDVHLICTTREETFIMSKTNKSSSKFCNIFPMKLTNNKITHENVIQSRMSKTQMRIDRREEQRTLSDEQIRNAYIKDTSIKTNVQLVANTYKNIAYDSLTDLLFSLCKRLNDRTFRYHKKYPDKKISFNAYHERVNDNVHSNIILTVPPEYDDVNVMKIVFDMEDLWIKLDDRKNPKFKLWKDFDVIDQVKCTNYAIKERYYVPITC